MQAQTLLGWVRLRRLGQAFAPRWQVDSQSGQWSWLPWLLLAGYALRLTAALSSDNFWRADEIYQYLEQAHRITFGYGYIPWEYETGVRTWLIAAVPLAMLQALDALGLGHPDIYIPAMRSFNATLSMLVPIGTYVLCRRLISESIARGALAIACLWYEFIALAPHAQAELYATYLFFAAAMLLRKDMLPVRALVVGCLLGLVVGMRFPYLLAVAPFGLMLILPGTQVPRKFLTGGGILGIIIWGLVDKVTWGGWFSSLFRFIENSSDTISSFGHFSPAHGIKLLFFPSAGIMLAAAVWAAVRWRRLMLIAIPLWMALAFHLFVGISNSYTNYALIIALAGVALADLCMAIGRSLQKHGKYIPYAPAAVLAGFSFVALAGLTPGHNHTEAVRGEYLFHHNARLSVLRELSRLPEGEVKSVFVDEQWLVTDTGGYYYLHHDATLLFPWSEPGHLESMTQRGRLDASKFATHAISRFPDCFPGFASVAVAGAWHLLRNDSQATIQDLPTVERKIGLPDPNRGAVLGQLLLQAREWHEPCS